MLPENEFTRRARAETGETEAEYHQRRKWEWMETANRTLLWLLVSLALNAFLAWRLLRG